MAIAFNAPANWTTTGNPTVTLTSFSAGDEVLIFGATEAASSDTLATPTATGLTFTLVTSILNPGDAAAYLWRATAAGSGASVVVTSTHTGTGQCGLAGWVRTGTAPGTTTLTGSNIEAAFSATTTAGADVIVAFAEFNAAPAGQTPLAGSGTATERVDVQSASHYTLWAADWTNCSAGTFNFGVSSYAGLAVAQVGVVLDAAGPATPVLDQSRYRFGADDGTESTHTFTAAENTGVTLAAAVPQLLRIQVDETAGVATSPRLAIQYKRSDEAATEWRNLTT